MTTSERLARGIEEVAAEIGGIVSVSARDLRRGEALDLRADERLFAASIIKVAILVELLAQAEAGEVRLDERRSLADAEKVPGSGVLSMLHPGMELTLEDLAHLMICVSDNTASNMLLGILGLDRVNQRMRSLGLTQTCMGRKFFDFEARERGLENWATAREMAELLTRIERREVVSASACEKMLSIMRRQQFDGRIPRLLPPDTPVANKTGSITGICHDIGIIYSPAGPLVLAVLTSGIAEPALAENGIRHIARLVYHHWGASTDA
ncbi:MAG: serine hydrolase [Armatimonadota bacterium]